MLKEPENRIISNAGNSLKQFVAPLLLILLFVVLQFSGYVDLSSIEGVAEAMKIVIVSIAVFYFGNILLNGNLDGEEIKKVYVIIILFIGAATFWSGFEQAGSALN